MQQGPGKSQGPQRQTGTQVKHLLPMLPGRARIWAVFTLGMERVGNNKRLGCHGRRCGKCWGPHTCSHDG